MTKHEFVLDAQTRANVGKGASRRLRNKQDGVPAIVYGGDKAPAAVFVSHDKLIHATANEAFFSSIVTLKIDGASESVIIKDLQRHPARPRLMHADFQRIQADHVLHVKVPLHFLNETTAVGVKQGGGIVSHLLTELEINCLPKDLPEYIAVDIAALNVGQSLHISDLKLPEGVTSVALAHGEEGNLGVVAIIPPQKAEEAAPAEPEKK
ncbi:MAG: 50S ribosomal protein L25/general stress protein Ctc [Pseudomonadales bacterium]|jgi:large subunit ribosomal protein L25|nr:50S ribosomal protein L25/general stress protein Ctc [Pseudomonadales bacterium]